MLFFDGEARRAAFVQQLGQGSADISVTEVREAELLKEALGGEQRAQMVETFLRHAFAKVGLSRIPCGGLTPSPAVHHACRCWR